MTDLSPRQDVNQIVVNGPGRVEFIDPETFTARWHAKRDHNGNDDDRRDRQRDMATQIDIPTLSLILRERSRRVRYTPGSFARV